jgi:hypothetical protein
MSKLDTFKKNVRQKNWRKNYEFGCSIDSEPVPNPVGFAEYLWMKPPVEVNENVDVSKRKK